MKFNKIILAAATLAVPLFAFAANNNISAGMQEPVTDVKAAAEKSAKPGCPMMARGSRQGMMGQGMGMQGNEVMMHMMDRQQMMERRMDMMEMMMGRQMGMQGGRGGPMMDGSRGGMPGMMGPEMQGQGMGMQGGPMMNNRMCDMQSMSPEQRQQMMNQCMKMMQKRMQQMPDKEMGIPGMQGGN